MTTLTPATTSVGPGPAMPVPAPRTAPAATAGLTGADVVRIIRHRLVLIIFLWIFSIGLTGGGYVLAKKYFPRYDASAYIRVTSTRPPDPLKPLDPQELREEDVLREIQTQALTVVSADVLTRALQNPELRATNWFREAEEKEAAGGDKPLDLLTDIISANPVPETNLFVVRAGWKYNNEVAKIVNTIIEEYMQLIDEQQKSSIRSTEQQLGGELELIKRDLDGKLKAITDFQTSQRVQETARKEVQEEVLTLKALETELHVDMLGKKSQLEALNAAGGAQNLPITPELQALLNQDPRIFQLDQRLQIAEEELNAALVRFGPNHRIVQEARMLRDAAADRVAEERARKTIEYQNEQIDAATRNYLEAQSQLLAITEQLFEARAEQEDMDRKYADFQRMQEEAEQLKLQYERLLDEKHLVTMALRAKRAVQIDIQSRAIQPERISSPLWQVWFPVGGLLGLAISVGFAMLLELADTSVRTARDVQRQAIPVLGTIPASEDEEIEITRVETVCIDAPQSILAEAFRNLRANLFFTAPADQQGVLLVTSPSGGNGKTTVATNLAISIALSGRRVLLIDANFRRASLPRVFPAMREEGLSNLLIGQSHLDDVVVPTSVPGLDVLSAGPPPPNPAELLGSSYFRDAIVDARARYDQVIFDGPPVLLVSDAIVLAGAVDGVLLVCQYRTTSRGALQRTQNQLEAINARIFGAVLNRVETRAGGYFRKAYREFYDYSEPEEGEGPEAKQLRADAGSAQLQPPPPGGPGRGGSGGGGGAPTAGIDQLVAGSAPTETRAAATEPDEAGLESIDDLGDDLDLAIDDVAFPEADQTAPEMPADSIHEPLPPDTDLDREIDNLDAEDWLSGDPGAPGVELGDDDIALTDDEAPPEFPDEPDSPQKPAD